MGRKIILFLGFWSDNVFIDGCPYTESPCTGYGLLYVTELYPDLLFHLICFPEVTIFC